MFISSFEIINVVIPDPKILFWIVASVADAAADPNGIKAPLAIGLSTLFIEGKPVSSNGLKSLPKNPPVCPILEKWIFDNLC